MSIFGPYRPRASNIRPVGQTRSDILHIADDALQKYFASRYWISVCQQYLVQYDRPQSGTRVFILAYLKKW